MAQSINGNQTNCMVEALFLSNFESKRKRMPLKHQHLRFLNFSRYPLGSDRHEEEIRQLLYQVRGL